MNPAFMRDSLLEGVAEGMCKRVFLAEVAELVDALDSKSSLAYPKWGFESPLRHPILIGGC